MVCFCSCSSGTFRLREENDIFGVTENTDSNYTQGLALRYDSYGPDNPVAEASAVLPSFSPSSPEVDSGSFEVGQQFYTPEHTHGTEIIDGENRYAGYLYGALSRHSQVEETKLDTTLALGVVGPWAFAKETQLWFHELIHNRLPQGWDTQLDNEPAIMITHDRSWKDAEGTFLSDYFSYDAISATEIRLGNVHTDISYFRTLRVGTTLSEQEKGFSWYLFGKTGTDTVLHDIFYDGNTFSDDPVTTHKRNLVGYLIPGIHLQYEHLAIDVSCVIKTKDFEEQTRDIQSYGIINVSVVPEKVLETINKNIVLGED